MIEIKGKDDLIANTANLLIQSFSAPLETTIIKYSSSAETETPIGRDKPWFTTDSAAPKLKRSVLVVPSTFKIALIAVIFITVSAGIAVAYMAASWLNPTSMQQSAFDGASSILKLGFGALLGLIGGKSAK